MVIFLEMSESGSNNKDCFGICVSSEFLCRSKKRSYICVAIGQTQREGRTP